MPQNQPDDDEWLRAAYAADISLNAIKAIVHGPPDEDAHLPWSGPDWEDLSRVPKVLLRYMHCRKRAACDDDLGRAVWGKREEEVTDGAIHAAKNDANRFLQQKGVQQVLEKPRGQRTVRWA